MRRLASIAALVAVACGGGPSTPTPVVPRINVGAPVPQAPIDDVTVQTPRPELRVTNATSDQPGDRTYDFQLADNAEFAGVPGSGVLLITKPGIPEGAEGRTVYAVEQDLAAPKRFFWRARAVQAGVTGPWSVPARFKTATAANPAPRITSLTATSSRAEVDTEVAVSAVVEDETPADQLIFEWTADKGTFTGTGPRVRWRAPRGERTPARYELKLTVTERYTSTDADGLTEQRENKVSGSTRVTVNDSRKEVTDLVLTFLGDFANSSVSPEVCVRNFSDNCPGKREELDDVRHNRATYTVTGSRFSVREVTFDQPMLWAEVVAPCEFTSTIKATGKIERATGNCLFTAVYEIDQWWLCDSRFRGSTSSGLQFLR